MGHPDGWIELYELLEEGRAPGPELVALCKSGRTYATCETMLHWYAIEGDPSVVQQLIDLGFDMDAVEAGGESPIYAAASLRRWEMVRVLRAAGAKIEGVNTMGTSYRATLCAAGPEVPADLRGDMYGLEDLLLPDGPEREPVVRLYLTRSGSPDVTSGHVLDRASWAAFVRGHPNFDPDDEVDEDQHILDWHNVECHGSCFFNEDEDLGLVPGVQVFVGGALGRRVAYEIAQHFGARVLWEFGCAPDPELPED